MARKYGFYRNDKQNNSNENEHKTISQPIVSVDNRSMKMNTKTSSNRNHEIKKITLRDVIKMDAACNDEPIDEFFDEDDDNSDYE